MHGRWCWQTCQQLTRLKAAGHFTRSAGEPQKVAGGRRLLDQLDTLKSLTGAEPSQTLLVLFGTYELRHFIDLSGQLAGRTYHIEFGRYDVNKSVDRQRFMSVVVTLQRYLPFQEPPELREHGMYLYQGSLGCVALLKDWLSRAFDIALQEDANTITLDHLRATQEPVGTLRKLAEEMVVGEEMYRQALKPDSDPDEVGLDNLLKMKKASTPAKEQAQNKAGATSKPSAENDGSPNGKRNGSGGNRSRPGVRAPERDPVETASHAEE